MAVDKDQIAAKPAAADTAPAATETVAVVRDDNAGSGVRPAPGFLPSGAPMQASEIDPAHPAVDNDPRAGTREIHNRIDFNDPRAPGRDMVAEALTAQGVPTKSGAEAAESIKSDK